MLIGRFTKRCTKTIASQSFAGQFIRLCSFHLHSTLSAINIFPPSLSIIMLSLSSFITWLFIPFILGALLSIAVTSVRFLNQCSRLPFLFPPSSSHLCVVWHPFLLLRRLCFRHLAKLRFKWFGVSLFHLHFDASLGTISISLSSSGVASRSNGFCNALTRSSFQE